MFLEVFKNKNKNKNKTACLYFLKNQQGFDNGEQI